MATSSCAALPEVAHSTARADSFELFVACVAGLGRGDAEALPIKARAFWSLLHGFVMLEIDGRVTGAPSARGDLRAALDCLVHGLDGRAIAERRRALRLEPDQPPERRRLRQGRVEDALDVPVPPARLAASGPPA